MGLVSSPAFTDQVDRVALITSFYRVVSGKTVPMFLLIRQEDAGPFTKRTNAVQGREDCCAYELGPVRYTFHSLFKRFRNLKCNNFRFFSSHGIPPFDENRLGVSGDCQIVT